MQLCGPIVVTPIIVGPIVVDLWTLVRDVLFDAYKMCKRFFISQGGFEVLILHHFKLPCVLLLSKASSESTQTSEMELYT